MAQRMRHFYVEALDFYQKFMPLVGALTMNCRFHYVRVA
jgi:hypothetical protein